ncbi:hypothetical protein L6255_03740 [Candidatus Parcubacteria bacterium]|nr:hypothetical protein [Patescibacteria group bacterium]MBU4380596.1 hypothetical protein [Patescibacteria group bacterium]MCG2689524.1 hypothetical protein [Candidatus Parcubacteria bacterium]
MVVSTVLLKTFLAAAGTVDPTRFPTAGGLNPDPACLQALETVYEKTLSTVFWGIGLASFFAIVMGGFKYMTAGGDDKALMSARQTLTYGIMGLVIAIASYAIFVGLDLAVFKVTVGPLLRFDIPGDCT